MIIINDLSVNYPYQKQPALSGINLSLSSGQIGVVLGGNDSGKSTLLNVLCGIIPKMQHADIYGSFQVNGNLGVALQDSDLFLMPTVAEELEFPLINLWRKKDVTKKRMDYLAEVFYLSSLFNRQIHTLSGGERQRVSLAASLAANPDILILDEPLAQLDPLSRTMIAEQLKYLAKEGKTILIGTSSAYQFDTIADTFFLLERGILKWQGSPDSFKEKHSEALLQGVDVDGNGLFKNKEIMSKSDLTSTNYSLSKALTMKKVQYQYAFAFALKDIDLEVNCGKIVAITGENGSGKTTLLKLAAGIIKPDSGQIEVLGKNIQDLTIAEATANSGFLFQNPDHQLFHNQVESELRWGLQKRGFNKTLEEERVNKWLELMNIETKRYEHPYSLSKVWRQWVALACILVREPALLLLDEPTFGMDTLAAKRFADLIRDLAGNNTSILLITHYDALARYCANSIISISCGKIIQTANVD